MIEVKYNMKIKILSSFNIASGEDRGGFIHNHTVKQNNKPYIPGSTIKGKLRDNFTKLTNENHIEKKSECDCIICKLFGKPGYYPSKVYIDNLYTDEEANITIKNGTSIDRYRKVVKDTALYSEEIVNNKEFNGEVTVYFDKQTIEYKLDFELAFKMIDSIGHGKSRGHGHVEVEIVEVS